MSTMSELDIDLGVLEPDHLVVVQDLYKFLGFLLDKEVNFSKLTKSDLKEVNKSLTAVKIRDGFLKYFSCSTHEVRLGLVDHVSVIAERMHDKDMPLDYRGSTHTILASLIILDTALVNEVVSSQDFVDERMAVVTQHINMANDTGYKQGLLGLFNVMISMGMPPRIFLDSMNNVSLEEVTHPTGDWK